VIPVASTRATAGSLRARFAELIPERVIVSNALSLFGTTLVTNAVGVLFWLLAARAFPKEQVGLGSAAISAMLFLGTLSTIGFNTLLVGEVARQRDRARVLVATALTVCGATGTVLGLTFAVVVPALSDKLDSLGANPAVVALFAAGVGLTTVGLVLDQALIGFLRGDLQLRRNAMLAVLKLLALAGFALGAASRTGLGLYGAWAIGNLLSLVALGAWIVRRERGLHGFGLDLALVRRVRGEAVSHHAFNLSISAPWMVLPVIVTIVLSPSINASFYAAATIVLFIRLIPSALTTVLYAVSASDSDGLARRMRFTLGLSFGIVLAALTILLTVPDLLLRVFGERYAQEASGTLRILAVGVLAEIVKTHWVAARRVSRSVGRALPYALCGTALVMGAAVAGAALGGLEGLAVGWLIGESVQGAAMAPLVVRTARLLPGARTLSATAP